MTKTSFSDDDEHWIVNCLNRGITVRQLADDLMVSHQTIWRAARNAGLARAVGRYPRIPEDIRDEIIEQIQAGHPLCHIASAYDIDPSVVSVLRTKAGITSRATWQGRKSRHNVDFWDKLKNKPDHA